MSRVTYRFAAPSDIDALVKLRLEFLAEGYPDQAELKNLTQPIRKYLMEMLPEGQFVMALAEADGIIVGTSGMVFNRHPPHPNHPNGLSPYIMNVYVQATYRRKGVATKLLQLLIKKAQESDATVVTLHHWPGKRELYAKTGFKLREREMILEL